MGRNLAVPIVAACLFVAAPATGARAGVIFTDGFETGAACAWSAYASPTIPGGCVIEAICRIPGEGAPGSGGCRTCDPSVSQTSWTLLADLSECDDGDACSLGDHCSIGDCTAGGSLDCDDGIGCTFDSCLPESGCHFEPQDATCDDLLACTLNSCSPVSDCQSEIGEGFCLIAGACYSDGDWDPSAACRHCAAALLQTGWINRPVGSECAPAVCSSATESSPADLCDGAGTCVDSGTVSCGSYSCNGANGACRTTCTTTAHCSPTAYCTAPSCVNRKTNGASCTVAEECLSSACVDGVCCNSDCSGLCRSCALAGSAGTCANVPYGQDPAEECPGATTCNGAGGCTLLPDGALCLSGGDCQSGSCVDGVCCNGACAGTCQACTAAKKGGGVDGVCGSIAALTDPDDECPGPRTCNGAGGCTLLPDGALCLSGGDCQSGNCVDGVCCGGACAGTCQACTAAKKGGGVDGVCGAIAALTDPDDECSQSPPEDCGYEGTCSGAGSCRLWPASTLCTPASCASRTSSFPADYCDGAGTCVDSGAVDCVPYACDDGSGVCFTFCVSGSQCAIGYRCEDGICQQ